MSALVVVRQLSSFPLGAVPKADPRASPPFPEPGGTGARSPPQAY
jgi:hypothetical protein